MSGDEVATFQMTVTLNNLRSIPPFPFLLRRISGYYEGTMQTTGAFDRSRMVFPPSMQYRVEGRANCITGSAVLFGYLL
jgi:hypothetical protein